MIKKKKNLWVCISLETYFLFNSQNPHLFAVNTRGQAKNSPVFYPIMSHVRFTDT